MMGLASFLEEAIHLGAIQLPPLADVKEDNAPKIVLVSENTEINLIMDDLAFAFEERAAILEYDGGYSREQAERLARIEIYGKTPEIS